MTEQTEKETPKSGQGIQWFQGEWIYVSGFIGIISLLVSRGITPIDIAVTYYPFYLLSLAIIYTYVRKMPAFFILKVSAVAIAVSISIVVGIIVVMLAINFGQYIRL